MPSYYFIGGAPRSGKSTVLERFISHKPMLSASTDAIRSVAKANTTPQANPALYKTERGAFDSDENIQRMTQNPEQSLLFEIAESTETWKSVREFLGYYVQDGRNTAIEGVAALPSKLKELTISHQAVFIVNLSDQTEIILDYAQKSTNDWLHKYDETTIRAFCNFNHLLNQFYADEATEFGYTVIDMSQGDFNKNVVKAVSALLEK